MDDAIIGGKLEIPDGFFVNHVDLDADEPFIEIIDEKKMCGNEKVKVLVPKSLAYYLKTHFCGSQKMHTLIENNARNGLRRSFKDLLEMEFDA